MEPLPRGAQFTRAKVLWEIALGVAGDPSIPYDGNRDVALFIGNGSQETFKPSIRLSPGSPILSHAVVGGELEAAFVNPSAILTQAYKGTGLYKEPLPVRVLFSYPSWDRFVIAVNPRLGLTSLSEIKEKQLPLRFSIREDATHSTRVLIDQLLPLFGFSLSDVEPWGGSFQLNGPPGDARRLAGIEDGSIDIVFDEGIGGWLPFALEHGMKPLELESGVMSQMEAIGWRKVPLPRERFPQLDRDYECIDYSGWPLYTRASLPDEDAYKICAALGNRVDQMPLGKDFTGLEQLGKETDATPRDVPLHPGAERWFRDQGYNV
ncbi:MAG: hypothetical protein BZY88_19940 [SAR202 cluster bacterium Io17-Chloro-G9]|nr:MAG: hypothetical protein BZY88_19940 [SAR202 cluster bacterium Io17-Chloro-G9]